MAETPAASPIQHKGSGSESGFVAVQADCQPRTQFIQLAAAGNSETVSSDVLGYAGSQSHSRNCPVVIEDNSAIRKELRIPIANQESR
jgi:hypothetical protein